jgi:hypothetical protein
LPVKAVAVPPSVYNWTGVYVGGHVGYGMGMKDWLNSSFAPGEVRRQLSLQRHSCRTQRAVLTIASETKAQARTRQLGQGETWQQA